MLHRKPTLKATYLVLSVDVSLVGKGLLVDRLTVKEEVLQVAPDDEQTVLDDV